MSFFDWFHDRINSIFGSDHASDTTTINPATGLPMAGGVDVQGNPYGTDLHDHHHHSSTHDSWDHSSSHDHWSHGGSSGSGSGFNDW